MFGLYSPGHTALICMFSFCCLSVQTLLPRSARETHGFQYACRRPYKVDNSGFGSIILWKRFVRNYPRNTGRSDDFAAGYFVLAEEVNRQLCTVHDAFVVYIGT